MISERAKPIRQRVLLAYQRLSDDFSLSAG
jgi:hypothetical protein